MNKADLLKKLQEIYRTKDLKGAIIETAEENGLPLEIHENGEVIRKEKDGTETHFSLGVLHDMNGILRKDLLRESHEDINGIQTIRYTEIKNGVETFIKSKVQDKEGNFTIEENIPKSYGIERMRHGEKKRVIAYYTDGKQISRTEEDGQILEVIDDGKGNKTEKRCIRNAFNGKISVLEEIQTSKDGSKTEKTFSLDGNIFLEVHTSSDGTKTTKKMNSDGKLEKERTESKNGDEEVKYYDTDGKLALTTIKNRQGIEVEYDKNGELQKLTIRKNGTTKIRTGLLARLSALSKRTPRRLKQNER